jgi:hypothetical protein
MWQQLLGKVAALGRRRWLPLAVALVVLLGGGVWVVFDAASVTLLQLQRDGGGNGQTRQTTAPVPAKFLGKTVRFQAGDYQRADDSAGPQDGGRVLFHRLAQQSTNS